MLAVYSYDPENRLTKVEYDNDVTDQTAAVPMAEYRYDALGRRIEYKRYDTGGALVETTRYYHDGQNVIAEYIVDGGGQPEALARSFVNGSQYIDERVVMRDYVTVAGNAQPRDFYYLHQELYSEAGLASANGALEEAYVYDTYGDAHIWQWRKGDFNRDGDVNNDDVTMFGDAPWFDLDFDGDTDSADQALMETGNNPTKLAYSAVNNPYLFTGRLTDTLHSDSPTDVAHIRRLQDNRNRIYLPKHGRWMQHDPLGVRPDIPHRTIRFKYQYIDGANLYGYVKGRPLNEHDPFGQLCGLFGSGRGSGVPSRDDVRFCYSPQDKGGPGSGLPTRPRVNNCVGHLAHYCLGGGEPVELGQPQCQNIQALEVFRELLKDRTSDAIDHNVRCGTSHDFSPPSGTTRLRPDGSGDINLILGVGGFDLEWSSTCTAVCGCATGTQCGCCCDCKSTCTVTFTVTDEYTFEKPPPTGTDNNQMLRCLGISFVGTPYQQSGSFTQTVSAKWKRCE